MRKFILLFCLMAGQIFADESGVDLTITVPNIKEMKGVIRIGVFKNEEDYKQKNNQIRKGTYPAVDKTLTVTYQNVPPGDYAIILFHDLNENDRNDSNAIGIPQEPFGLSNNIKPGIGLPAFSRTKFSVLDKNVSVTVELQRYTKKWSVGVGAIATQSAYKDSKPRYLPLPIITFQGDKLDILGTQVHYTLWRNEKMFCALGVKLNFDGYDENDSSVFKGLSDRKMTLEGGVKVQYKFNKNWTLKTDAYYDLLGVSDGLEGSVSLARSFGGRKYILTPSIGFKWQDPNFADYYYGVQNNESTSSRTEYHPSFSFNPNLDCSLLYFWNDNWASFLTLSGTYLDKEIQNSPLVDKKVNLSLLAAFVYRF